MSQDPDRELMESLRPHKEYFQRDTTPYPRKSKRNPTSVIAAIGCGGVITLFIAISIAITCEGRSAGQKELARKQAIVAERLAAAEAAEAAFAAIPPAEHLSIANKTMDARKTDEVGHHLSKIPTGFPGLEAAKTRLTKLEAKAKAEIEAKAKAKREAERKEAAIAEAKERAEWRKEGVSIGMTAERVRLSSWGRPNHINRTIYGSGVREQWVYNGGYLYFEDGILTAIQN